MTDLTCDLALALAMADSADRITLDRAGAADLRVEAKPDRSPVTDADLAVEDAIRAVLRVHRPRDEVIGEERGGASGDAGRAWLLDPIDGTKNFLRGVPVWATLITLVEDGEPAVGVISAPALRRRWWAATGAGAHTRDPNGTSRAITVSGVGDLADAYLSTTDLGSWTRYRSRESYLSLVDATWESRAFGDFWQHCLVAEGGVDVAAEPSLQIWDFSAVKLIVEEAGGRCTTFAGGVPTAEGSFLATNSRLHETALALLMGTDPSGPSPAF